MPKTIKVVLVPVSEVREALDSIEAAARSFKKAQRKNKWNMGLLVGVTVTCKRLRQMLPKSLNEAMGKKLTIDQRADRALRRHVITTEQDAWARFGFVRGFYAGRPSRKQVMAVLDRELAEGGYKITVRSYNKILTGLGYRLT